MCFWRAQMLVKFRRGSRLGGIFEETCRFVIVDDGVHSWRDVDGIAHARGGAIKRLNIRTVDTKLSNVH
jgi:hypothetical protein